MGSFSDFLFNLPETHYSKINAVKTIDNGHGGELNAKMIEANEDERLLAYNLDPKELNSYAEKKYGVDKIDASGCWPDSCVLEEGKFRNSIKNHQEEVTLSSLKNTKAKIAANAKGEIFVTIDIKGNKNEINGAMWTEQEPIQIDKNDAFHLIASKLVSERGVWIRGNQEHQLLLGRVYFEGGEMYIEPIENDEDYAVIDNLKIRVFKPERLKITSEKPSNVFSKELYLGSEQIIATCSYYRIIFL